MGLLLDQVNVTNLGSSTSNSMPTNFEDVPVLRLRVMRLILNIIFSGVIVNLAYKSTTAFRFTSWLISVMNKGKKD